MRFKSIALCQYVAPNGLINGLKNDIEAALFIQNEIEAALSIQRVLSCLFLKNTALYYLHKNPSALQQIRASFNAEHKYVSLII